MELSHKVDMSLRTDARMAGRVLRYHTWPHIRPQSVGEHSWQVARIVLAIYPEASVAILKHCINHDVGELRTGDLPYPIKLDNPVLGDEMHRIEEEAIHEILGEWGISSPDISERERWIFKTAEFLEMWEWGLEEGLLGNRFADKVADRCYDVVIRRLREANENKDDIVRAVVTRVTLYIEKRREHWLTSNV